MSKLENTIYRTDDRHEENTFSAIEGEERDSPALVKEDGPEERLEGSERGGKKQSCDCGPQYPVFEAGPLLVGPLFVLEGPLRVGPLRVGPLLLVVPLRVVCNKVERMRDQHFFFPSFLCAVQRKRSELPWDRRCKLSNLRHPVRRVSRMSRKAVLNAKTK